MLIALLCGRLHADTIVSVTADGTTQTFAGVTVEKGLRDPAGKVWLQVRFPDNRSHPVDISQIQRIDFGDTGQGRKFDIKVGSGTNPNEIFNGATIFKYEQGQFEAVPPDDTTRYLLAPDRIASFEQSVSLAPGSSATPPAANEGGESEDLFQNSSSPSTVDSGEGTDEDEDEDVGDSSSASTSPMTSGVSPGGLAIGLGAAAAYLLIAIVSFITWIWLIVYAFKEGEIAQGFIVLFCGCLLIKYYYATKYVGGNRGLLMGLLLAELIGGLLLTLAGHLLS
ncbi:MAG TPA: hypothetical protein PKD58_00115 [Candidatus Sumerlaeota bacterium]|nr:hypothetical protein [Candidatus Sumerlaeota bacterium]HMZ50848.1 hypothetical protein [Candidatus Sumerlaeota bacterium]HNM46374.1 hypothetical protein [Candidatus Sumerlaeota bacterium]